MSSHKRNDKSKYYQLNSFIKDFCNIILEKKDDLDLYNIDAEIKLLTSKDNAFITDSVCEEYFFDHIHQFHYEVEINCLKYIKQRADNCPEYSPYSFYEYGLMLKYVENLQKEFKSCCHSNLPTFIITIIEWIIIKCEEYFRTTFCAKKQIESYNNVNADNIKRVSEDLTNLNNQLSELSDSVNEAKSKEQNFINKIQEVEEESKDKLHKTEKSMIETNISILGVFSAVVLTFNMGISFASDVLQEFMKSGTFHSVLVIILFGFIIGNVIFALFAFLRYVRQNENSEKFKESLLGKIVILFNVVLAIFLFIDFIFWFCLSFLNLDIKGLLQGIFPK